MEPPSPSADHEFLSDEPLEQLELAGDGADETAEALDSNGRRASNPPESPSSQTIADAEPTETNSRPANGDLQIAAVQREAQRLADEKLASTLIPMLRANPRVYALIGAELGSPGTLEHAETRTDSVRGQSPTPLDHIEAHENHIAREVPASEPPPYTPHPTAGEASTAPTNPIAHALQNLGPILGQLMQQINQHMAQNPGDQPRVEIQIGAVPNAPAVPVPAAQEPGVLPQPPAGPQPPRPSAEHLRAHAEAVRAQLTAQGAPPHVVEGVVRSILTGVPANLGRAVPFPGAPGNGQATMFTTPNGAPVPERNTTNPETPVHRPSTGYMSLLWTALAALTASSSGTTNPAPPTGVNVPLLLQMAMNALSTTSQTPGTNSAMAMLHTAAAVLNGQQGQQGANVANLIRGAISALGESVDLGSVARTAATALDGQAQPQPQPQQPQPQQPQPQPQQAATGGIDIGSIVRSALGGQTAASGTAAGHVDIRSLIRTAAGALGTQQQSAGSGTRAGGSSNPNVAQALSTAALGSNVNLPTPAMPPQTNQNQTPAAGPAQRQADSDSATRATATSLESLLRAIGSTVSVDPSVAQALNAAVGSNVNLSAILETAASAVSSNQAQAARAGTPGSVDVAALLRQAGSWLGGASGTPGAAATSSASPVSASSEEEMGTGTEPPIDLD